VVLLSLITSIVYAVSWNFQYPITVTDTSGNPRTNYPTDLEFGASALVSSGQIDADGLNTNMQIGASDVPFMLSDDRVLTVIPSIPASGDVAVDFYTGYDPPQTTFPIITGQYGFVTTADNINLELTSQQFVIDIGAYLSTEYSTGLYFKQNSVYMGYSGGTLTASIESAVDFSAVVTDGTYLYISPILDSPKIYKVDATMLDVIAVLDLGETEHVKNLFYNNGIIYAGVDSLSVPKMYEIGTDMVVDDSLDLSSDLSSIGYPYRNSWATHFGDYLYFIGEDLEFNMDCVYKIKESDFTYIGHMHPTHVGSSHIQGIYQNSGYIFGYAAQVDSNIFKIDLATFTESSHNHTNVTDAGYAVTVDNTYVYLVNLSYVPGTHTEVRRFNTSDLAYVDTLDPAGLTGDIPLQCIIISGNLYVTGKENGVHCDLSKIDLTSFTETSAISNISLYNTTALVNDGTYLYVISAYDGNMSSVLLSGFTVDRTLPALVFTTELSAVVAEGYHTISFSRPANTTLTLSVDSVEVDAVDYIETGFSVRNNSNDIIVGNDTTYMNYLKLSLMGTEVLWYEPNTIIISDTLPDRDGTQDGIITWGANQDLTITIGGGIGGGGDTLPPKPGFNLPNSPLPATWFANCENAANLPFYDSFSEVAFQTGMDLCLLYFMLIIGLAIGTFLLLIMATRSALLGAVGFNVVLFIGSSMTIVAMWIPFVCLIIMIGIMFLYKQVAY
jgi:hypothetical protein